MKRAVSHILFLSILVGALSGCTTYNVVTPTPPKAVPVPTYDKKEMPTARVQERKRVKKEEVSENLPKCQEPAYWKKEKDGYVCTPPPQPPPMVVVPPYGYPGWYGYGWPYRYW